MRLGAGWVSHPKGMLTACGGGGGRDYQGRLQDETIRDQPGADLPGGWVVWWIGQTPAAPSGREWQGAQTGQCAAELAFAGPALGQMQGGRRAERVSLPAREKKRRRRVLVVTACSARPIRAVQRNLWIAMGTIPFHHQWLAMHWHRYHWNGYHLIDARRGRTDWECGCEKD